MPCDAVFRPNCLTFVWFKKKKVTNELVPVTKMVLMPNIFN